MVAKNVFEFKREVKETIKKEVEQYLTQRKQRNKNTYRNYLTDIEHFFEHVFGKPYSSITTQELNSEKTELDGLMKYFDSLYNMKKVNGKRMFANGTINRKQASVKSLLKFLKVKKVFHHDLSELEVITNLPKKTKNIENVSFETAMKYAEWFRQNEVNKSKEKYIITKLAIDIGKRATELLTLEWNQFLVRSEYVLVSGIGKGEKKWTEKISVSFYEEITELKGNSNRVFSLSYNDLVRMTNRAKKALGDTDRAISFHSFRKCSITVTYRLTGDILEAQRKANHSSLDTTKIYIEAEDYGMTGLISLGDSISNELYKDVDKDTLVEAIELMNKDFMFILNYKINEIQEKKAKESR